MAASGVDAHEGIARGAKFGARLIVTTATAEKSACGVSPTIKPLLPLIGNGQSASLRAAEGVPIIPELDCGLRSPVSGPVLTGPDLKKSQSPKVNGFQSLYLPTAGRLANLELTGFRVCTYKPLEKQVGLTNPEL